MAVHDAAVPVHMRVRARRPRIVRVVVVVVVIGVEVFVLDLGVLVQVLVVLGGVEPHARGHHWRRHGEGPAGPGPPSRNAAPTPKDPSFRPNASFTGEELERLISEARILEDRRLLYGLKGVAGLRHGEAARLCWRHYDSTLDPVGALDLERTKTQVPRRLPVHPTLPRLLAEWKLAGWERTYGRAPTPEDVIVPTRNLTERPSPDSQHAFLLDLAS